jgi:putative transposase
MAKTKHHTPEPIIHLLRQAEVELATGHLVPQVCRKLGIADQTYYRWRKEYGGTRTDQAERLKDLERENARLKKLVAEAELDKAILREAAAGNF